MAADRRLYVGPSLRRLRRDLGLTQADMAADLEISASYIALLERNHRPLTRRPAAAAGADLQDRHGRAGRRRRRRRRRAAAGGAEGPDVRRHRPAGAGDRRRRHQLPRHHRGAAAALHRLSGGAAGAGRPRRRGSGAAGDGRARSGGRVAALPGRAAQQLSRASTTPPSGWPRPWRTHDGLAGYLQGAARPARAPPAARA